jgi:hypothetical protein
MYLIYIYVWILVGIGIGNGIGILGLERGRRLKCGDLDGSGDWRRGDRLTGYGNGNPSTVNSMY